MPPQRHLPGGRSRRSLSTPRLCGGSCRGLCDWTFLSCFGERFHSTCTVPCPSSKAIASNISMPAVVRQFPASATRIPTCSRRCIASSISSLTRIPVFFTSQTAEDLADELVAHAPEGLNHVSYAAEAVEAALKLARQYFVERGQPQRRFLIALGQS